MRKARPRYPRVNCLVPGCKRGTTRCAPEADGSEPEIICDPHWRTVPITWRKRLSLYRRRYTLAERKGDERGMEVAARCWWHRWEAITRLFKQPAQGEAIDPLMAEGLRKAGLL